MHVRCMPKRVQDGVRVLTNYIQKEEIMWVVCYRNVWVVYSKSR